MDENKSLRTGDATKTTIEPFICRRLQGTARIKIERRYCTHEDPRDTHLKMTSFMECANKFDCGLARWTLKPYAWEMTESPLTGCDAERTFKENDR